MLESPSCRQRSPSFCGTAVETRLLLKVAQTMGGVYVPGPARLYGSALISLLGSHFSFGAASTRMFDIRQNMDGVQGMTCNYLILSQVLVCTSLYSDLCSATAEYHRQGVRNFLNTSLPPVWQ